MSPQITGTSGGTICPMPQKTTVYLPDELKGRIWRGKYAGQTQKWYAAEFLGTDADIDLTPPKGERQEFKAYRWMDLAELAEGMWEVKRPIYLALVEEWAERLRAWAEPD